MKTKFFLIAICILEVVQSLATTCVAPNDWVDRICKLPDTPGTRCANVEFFQAYCNNDTVGCSGGCYGFTPPGHYYALIDAQQVPVAKCRCGCFGENTTFNSGGLAGKSLIRQKELGNDGVGLWVETTNSLNATATEMREINGIIYSIQDEILYEFRTSSGRSLTVSGGHPMAIGYSDGSLDRIKKAEDVTIGEFFLGQSGDADKIHFIKKIKSNQAVFNFNVKSTNSANHLLYANDLKTGDLAMQEHLNSVSTRLLWRSDLEKYIGN